MGLADCPEKTCFAVHAELEQEVLHGFVNECPVKEGLIVSIGLSLRKRMESFCPLLSTPDKKIKANFGRVHIRNWSVSVGKGGIL